VIDEAGAARLLPVAKRKKTRDRRDVERWSPRWPASRRRRSRRATPSAAQPRGASCKAGHLRPGRGDRGAREAIKLNRSGLGGADKPIGSFLFAGPTGVGKTELAGSSRSVLGIELIRFDMSEYMERHTVSA
jgi:ATP-dependent Clp protease ATP-binding subunit ClpA